MSVFENEWRACLREQYKHTIRENNPKNIHSLKMVMSQLGFGDDELHHLELIATMHIDDVADDFMPNFDILDDIATQAPVTEPSVPVAHPLECQCPACVNIVMTPHDDEGQPITDPEAIIEHKAKKAKDKPKQLRLF